MFIIINDRFSTSRGTHGWTLIDTQQKTRLSDGETATKSWKKGDPYRTTDQTHHGKLLHALNKVIDKSAGAPGIKTLEDMRNAVLRASGDCVKAIEAAGVGD